MKKLAWLVLGALACAPESVAPDTPSFTLVDPGSGSPVPVGPAVGLRTLTFSDEFSGTKLNTNRWDTNYPYNRPPAHGELAGYAASAVKVANGLLHLTATKQPLGTLPYTSGMVSSGRHFSWQFGIAEIRLKTPAGVGYWPAFWTMNIPFGSFPPEIDMLELKGGKPTTIWMGHYWGDWRTQIYGWQRTYIGPNYTTGFHTVTVRWTRTSLTWWVDGIQVAQHTTNIPQTGMYLIANLAIGGTFGGTPTSATVFPGTMQVDYIRIWQ
jgi:beta-glucanase (GH16 family)